MAWATGSAVAPVHVAVPLEQTCYVLEPQFGRRCGRPFGHKGDHRDAEGWVWGDAGYVVMPQNRYAPITTKVGVNISPEGRAHLLANAFIGIEVPPETATRVARWLETFAGPPISDELPSDVRGPIMLDNHNELVMVKDIEFTALCEHHLLPFTGRAAVGYIPNGQIIGLSKLARIVHHFTQRPSLQERITTRVADALVAAIAPDGVMVVLYNTMHSCMSMRGVKEHDATTTTSAVRGVFRTEPAARQEFLAFLSNR